MEDGKRGPVTVTHLHVDVVDVDVVDVVDGVAIALFCMLCF